MVAVERVEVLDGLPVLVPLRLPPRAESRRGCFLLQITRQQTWSRLWLPGVTSSRQGFRSTLAVPGPAGLVVRVSCLGQTLACKRSPAAPWHG